jgi:hypothetical protein
MPRVPRRRLSSMLQSPGERPMADDYPLSILDHRITTTRDRIRAMSGELASRSGEERSKLSDRIAEMTRELDDLIDERDILAADAR